MCGRCKREARMSLQRSSCAAQSATTHSENTAKTSDFAKGKIIKLAFELRNLGYPEAYLKTLIRALNCIASKVNIDNTAMVLELIARGKWRDSYKSNLCDFYSHCCKFYNINLARASVLLNSGNWHEFVRYRWAWIDTYDLVRRSVRRAYACLEGNQKLTQTMRFSNALALTKITVAPMPSRKSSTCFHFSGNILKIMAKIFSFIFLFLLFLFLFISPSFKLVAKGQPLPRFSWLEEVHGSEATIPQ